MPNELAQAEPQPALLRISEAWSSPARLGPLIGTEGYRLPDIAGHAWHRIGAAERDNWFVAPPEIPPDRFRCEFSGQHNVVIYGAGSIMRGHVGMLSDSATVIIGEHSGHGSAGNITVHGFGHGGVFFLGARTSSNQATFFVQGDASRLIIGEDCMFAHGITCRTDDDHAIFSMSDGAQINPAADIHISPHVWVCPEVSVLRGVTIGFGSVVGLKSLVNRSIPPFCLAGGAPARVLREDVSWDRMNPPRAFLRQSLKDWYEKIIKQEPRRLTGEAIRLVIWDLDETFWRGTVSEGGMTEYVRMHHDIVVELARRGIMSSICSKNDEATIAPILQREGIEEYFIFRSISWAPKGPRLAALVEAVQLRPATVLFIDDNASNRAEAAACVPGMQIADERIIPYLLGDPLLAGKPDPELTRLGQYKLLEARKRDEAASGAAGGGEDFLRGCDIRVQIDYDVAANIDRAIELINRTNQLNYTKKRLPENIEDARRRLLADLNGFWLQSGLVRVADKYGDYGYVGFFQTSTLRRVAIPGTANAHLEHFCFSCRTLGMYVEQWVYEHLNRPELEVVGEVLTDLSVPRAIDWIRQVPAIEHAVSKLPRVAPAILLHGGCEANAISVYLNGRADRVNVFGNYTSGGLFVRVNSAQLALDMSNRAPGVFAAEAENLGLPLHLTAHDMFAGYPPGSGFIFNCGRDAEGGRHYRHKIHGWTIMPEVIDMPDLNLARSSEEEIAARLRQKSDFSAAQREHVLRAARHMREHYEFAEFSKEQQLDGMRGLIARVPKDSKFIVMLDHDEWGMPDGVPKAAPWVSRFNAWMHELASHYAYVGVVCFTDVIAGPHELQPGGNHYHREVYLRMANRIAELLESLPGKTTGAL